MCISMLAFQGKGPKGPQLLTWWDGCQNQSWDQNLETQTRFFLIELMMNFWSAARQLPKGISRGWGHCVATLPASPLAPPLMSDYV